MAEMKFSTLDDEKLAKLKLLNYKRFMFIYTSTRLTRYNEAYTVTS